MSAVQFDYDTIAFSALTDADRTVWRLIRAGRPALASPFFSLGWHDAVDATRGDVEVVRISLDGEARGFFPFVRGPLGMMRPAGAPMADWHGFVGPVGLAVGAESILRAAGGKAFRFSGAAADDPVLALARDAAGTSFVMDISGGYDAYEAGARKQHPKAFRNLRARARKLHERHVEIRLDDRDPENLATVLAMKRSQYRNTRQIDIFEFRWTRGLVETLFARRDDIGPEGARGLLSTLWIDGLLAAGHFGLKGDAALHYWFPVYDARFADLSPGIILLHEIAKASTVLGIQRIDLGDGDYRFKEEFADELLPIIGGTARLASRGERGRPKRFRADAEIANPVRRRIPRISHALTRRVDLMSALHRWSPARDGGVSHRP